MENKKLDISLYEHFKLYDSLDLKNSIKEENSREENIFYIKLRELCIDLKQEEVIGKKLL